MKYLEKEAADWRPAGRNSRLIQRQAAKLAALNKLSHKLSPKERKFFETLLGL
jgi:hypothetical protein